MVIVFRSPPSADAVELSAGFDFELETGTAGTDFDGTFAGVGFAEDDDDDDGGAGGGGAGCRSGILGTFAKLGASILRLFSTGIGVDGLTEPGFGS